MNNPTFLDLELSEPILRTLSAEGFHTPTPVQAQTIPLILAGRDILASAQTGSGKTAAFVLPILQLLAAEQAKPEPRRPRALILAPTRELAAQIGEVLETFTRGMRLSTAVIYGGVGKQPQIKALSRGAQIVVATPGRLLDLMGEGELTLDRVGYIVLDEADRMLDMGFIPDVERIIKRLPNERQSLFFSATLPPEVIRLANAMLTNPERISVESERSDEIRIDQHIMFMERDDKRDALRAVLTERGSYRALVFTRTKYKAKNVAKYLGKNGIRSDDLHGDKSQTARTRALADFHSGKIQVLVATDIASRGIDVDDIDHVVNYELPNEAESYVHRIGRTARAGRTGTALSFCDESELANLTIIERGLRHQIPVLADHPHHAAKIASAALGGKSRRGSGAANGSGEGPRGNSRHGRNDSRPAKAGQRSASGRKGGPPSGAGGRSGGRAGGGKGGKHGGFPGSDRNGGTGSQGSRGNQGGGKWVPRSPGRRGA